jgi:hypothetical protein
VVSSNEEAGSITFCPVASGQPAAWRRGGGIPQPGGAEPDEAGQGWQHILVRGVEVPDVRVPPALTRRSRCNRIIGNGSWEIPHDEPAPLAIS